jgi:hypothetical protein
MPSTVVWWLLIPSEQPIGVREAIMRDLVRFLGGIAADLLRSRTALVAETGARAPGDDAAAVGSSVATGLDTR